MSFLHTTASQLYSRHKEHLHRLAVVFPNRRQAVFFRHYFTQVATPPAFIPEFFTIEELVQLSCSQTIAEPMVQSFELYKAYKTVCMAEGEDELKIQDYEQFYSVGELLLKDFREIDAYLVSIDEIGKVLYNLEAIEKAFEQLTDEQKEFLLRFWASVTNKGRVQEAFLKLWKRLPSIYQHFHGQLLVQGLATLGMAYRQLANESSTNTAFGSSWNHVAFVGFNAFNKAEEIFLKRWQEDGYASFWFDTDQYYLNNPLQEAGYFLRRNFSAAALKNQLPALNIISKKIHAITVAAVSGRTAQAKLVDDWLLHLPNEQSLGSAAILLADETLLLPVLQSLPDDGRPINVTMGYPLQQTVLFSFFNLFLDIQTDLATNHYKSLHYQFVNKWLDHPLCDWSKESRTRLQDRMLKEVMIQVSVKWLQKQSTIGNLLFTRIGSFTDVFNRLRQILQSINENENVRNDGLLQGAVSVAWQLMLTAEPLFVQLSPTPSLSFLWQVMRKMFSGISIPFEGEPLQGIQIMGLLESRGLDFDHILLLGASEGSLPRVKPPQTFLPDGVRRAFGLPVPEHQDAIFAYTFYRLLHNSQSLHLAYNALVTDNSTGEPSRFIQQLAFETQIPFVWQRPGTLVKPTGAQVISVEKTPEIQRLLGKYLMSDKPAPFSATQLNSYLACRLQFFLKNLAHLNKPDELSEEVDAATFGKIVHKLMERLYEAVKKKQGNWLINADTIQWMREQIPLFIEPVFREEISGGKDTQPMVFNGLQQVIKDVVIQYANGFLQLDETYAPFTIESLEVSMLEPFLIHTGGSSKTLFVKGIIDRVDEKNGVYRMVDYKTGSDKTEFYNVEKLFEREGKKQNKAALQTLIYSWMFQQKFKERERFEPALIPLRAVSKSGVATQLIMQETKELVSAAIIKNVLDEVGERMKLLLEEIFEPSVPFNQTDNLKTCAYCDFAGICRREQA